MLKMKVMKQRTCLVALLGAMLVFSGCKSDVDLNNLDTTIGSNIQVAFPLGEFNAKITDFIGGDDVAQYVRVDSNGLLFFQDTFYIEENYREVNLAQYVPRARKRFKVSDGVEGGLIVPMIPAGAPLKLVFPVEVNLVDLNMPDGTDRIDSMQIEAATFLTSFSVEDLDLPFDDVKKFEIVLDENFRRSEGDTVDVPLLNEGYGKDIEIPMNDFSLNFMKDEALLPSYDNVLTKVSFDLVFTIVLSNDIVVNPTSYIDFEVQIDFLKYNALWGRIAPGSQMNKTDTIRILDHMSEWSLFADQMLPLADPQVDVYVTTAIAGPLRLQDAFIFVESDSTQEQVYASFNGENTFSWPMEEYLSPYSPIDDVVVNHMLFNRDEDKGEIDKLFAIHPDRFAYCFNVIPDDEKAAEEGIYQYRITENTNIDLDIVTTVPFSFNDSLKLAYTDTTNSFYIEGGILDSLLHSWDSVVSTELKDLYIICQAANTIPFDINLGMTFLDKDNQVIDAIIFPDTNYLFIAGATEVVDSLVVEPTITEVVFNIDAERSEKLRNVKRVIYDAHLGGNTAPVKVLGKSGLSFKMVISADVKAVTNLDSIFNSTSVKGGNTL